MITVGKGRKQTRFCRKSKLRPAAGLISENRDKSIRNSDNIKRRFCLCDAGICGRTKYAIWKGVSQCGQ